MEPLNAVQWDVLIIGTSLAQSLLALSLSRTNLKVLHIDEASVYGGSEAALSLQDAEILASTAPLSPPKTASYAHGIHDVRITKTDPNSNLAFPRAYSLALAPQIIYTRSALIPALVSSKVYRQLEFLAVGNWFIFEEAADVHAGNSAARLKSIPSSREDIFADKSLDLRAKRALVKFIKAATSENEAFLEAHGREKLRDVLEREFSMGQQLRDTILALTLLPDANATVNEALPRVARHLSSIGVFGSGFGAVVPKWGGLSEVTQVSCRAGAVGGAVYALGRRVESQTWDEKGRWSVDLGDGDVVSTKFVVRSDPGRESVNTYRSISVVSDNLSSLFTTDAERTKSSGSVVVFPAVSVEGCTSPIYVSVHSSDTGECPAGQCVVYAQTTSKQDSTQHLLAATRFLLDSVNTEAGMAEAERPEVLWTMTYTVPSSSDSQVSSEHANEIHLEPLSPDLAFDDTILRSVRTAWQTITGQEEGFLAFEDREVGAYDLEEEIGE